MKKLLTIAALLISFNSHAVDLSGFGINTVNPGYHFTAKVAVKGIITGKVVITKDILSCQALLEDYKVSVANLKNTDIKFKGTCAINKTGKAIGWNSMIPAGFFNS